jgi:hypothetical protein
MQFAGGQKGREDSNLDWIHRHLSKVYNMKSKPAIKTLSRRRQAAEALPDILPRPKTGPTKGHFEV